MLTKNKKCIDFTVLSAPVPHIYNEDDKMAGKAVREFNQEIADIVKGYHEYFAFTVVVSLPDVKWSIE